jgi:hypothetical protein
LFQRAARDFLQSQVRKCGVAAQARILPTFCL